MDRSECLQVLLVEDHPGDARLFEEYVQESEQEVAVRWEQDLDSALQALSRQRPHVVAVDLHLPDSDGIETVQACVEQAGSVPVVVLTGEQELETAMASLEAGAIEYLQKNELTPSLVGRTLRWAVERGQMEKRLRLLSQAVEETTEAIFMTEADGEDPGNQKIIYTNPAFEDMTGYTRDEVRGQGPEILQGSPSDSAQLDEFRDAVRGGETWRGDVVNHRKDGTPYIVQWTVAPVTNAKGEIEYWVSVQRDVTDIRRMWERLLEIQEEERRRIDQEIHDEMGGMLASLQMVSNMARTNAEAHGAPTESFDEMTDMLNDLSLAIRTVARQLHPRVLDNFGLSKAISALVRKIEEQHAFTIDTHIEISSDDRYPSVIERAAYRVAQEALVNVARHADTDTAQIVMNETEEGLRIHVIDHGVGFDPAEREDEENFGLNGIVDRVERLNGSVDISSTVDEGTRISARLPLRPPSVPAEFADRESLCAESTA